MFGGSFNPAHAGHRHVSLLALKRLDLDAVWWLVSPQNPLKPEAGMAPFKSRLESARAVANHPRLRVMDIERRLGTRYTVDTIARLKRSHPRIDFVWIMGADNLPELARWKRWPEIFRLVPIAIFDRSPYAPFVRAALPTQRFARYRLGERRALRLARQKPPAWLFLHSRLHPASATALRAAAVRETARGEIKRRAESAGKRTVIGAPNNTVEHERGTAKESGSGAERNGGADATADAVRAVVEQALDEAKCEDVVTISLAGKSTIADYMIVASGRSSRQVGAAADRVIECLKAAKMPALSVEGLENKDWVLIDARDVIVHLFRPEIRAFYNIEKMWAAELPGEAHEHSGGVH